MQGMLGVGMLGVGMLGVGMLGVGMLGRLTSRPYSGVMGRVK